VIIDNVVVSITDPKNNINLQREPVNVITNNVIVWFVIKLTQKYQVTVFI
jgi:hypothetical protein